MNIIIISYIYPKKINPSQGIFIHQQAKYIAKKGHYVEFITTGSLGDKKKEAHDGINVHRVADVNHPRFVAGIMFIFSTLRKILELNRKKKIDLIMGEFVGITTIAVGILAKLLGKKFVLISHGTKWEIQNRWYENLMIRLALYFPDKLICCSSGAKGLLERKTNKKIHVINYGMDPELLIPSKNAKKFKKELGISNRFVILTVSNLVHKKGINVIIKAVSNASKKYNNIVHLVVGEGYERKKLEALVKKLNLEGIVRFEGRKVGRELANYYNACDLFVLMSRDSKGEIESFGIVYIEAAYFGKPVIGGVSGGTGDAVADGKTGFLIDSRNQKELEQAIIKLIKDKALREKLGNAGKNRVLNGFLWKHNVEKVLKICIN